MDGGISFIEAWKRLDSQSDTLTRETTQSPSASCGESSSKSVASQVSLKSQACPLPVSPVEPHMISEDHPICAAGNTVQRSSTKTRMEENGRIVATAPLSKYEDDEVVNTFLKCMSGSPSGCGAAKTLDAIVPFSQPRLQEQLLPHMIHDGSSRDHPNSAFLVTGISFLARDDSDTFFPFCASHFTSDEEHSSGSTVP